MTKTKATSIGFIAIVLWALLALFTVGSAPVPPLQLNALSFLIGGGLGIVWILSTGGLRRLRGVSWRVYAFGTLGLFGYHALYFSALRLAPPAQAGLIAYLWPLLIILFAGLLPSERLRLGHIIGGLVGFSGAAVIILSGESGFDINALPGYLLAMVCAVTWAGYSVLSRRLGETPTETVVVFCLATSALSGILHLLFEQTTWPENAMGWASVAALGLGPVGAAFYVWDFGVKKGDIQLLGVASYAAPLLSTLVLVLAGVAEPSLGLLVAALLITAGALIAARTSLKNAP